MVMFAHHHVNSIEAQKILKNDADEAYLYVNLLRNIWAGAYLYVNLLIPMPSRKTVKSMKFANISKKSIKFKKN